MPKRPPAKDLATAFEFFSELGILHQLSRTRMERRLPDGIGFNHYSVISHMVRTEDGKSPLTLAKILQVSKGSMTNTLAGLESRKLVRIAPNPKDGRGKLVYLTAKGRKLRVDGAKMLTPDLEVLARRFDLKKLKPLMPTIAELREVMDLYRDDD